MFVLLSLLNIRINMIIKQNKYDMFYGFTNDGYIFVQLKKITVAYRNVRSTHKE